MAPRGLKRKAKSGPIDYAKASRPARGYHLYKNGLLNVTPKTSAQVKLVQTNQETSPLLRLPGEVREIIWMAVFRDVVFENRTTGRRKCFVVAEGDRQILSLLRTCRQIYTETALLPYQVSIFRINSMDFANTALRKMRPAFRKHITKIEIGGLDALYGPGEPPYEAMNRLLPNLKIVTCGADTQGWSDYGEDHLFGYTDPSLPAGGTLRYPCFGGGDMRDRFSGVMRGRLS
ncbi:hypothetical protein DM02DRAFT_695629 [Periconia macrospinosa]|uniref:Uncharacterized protein n=1 Tax=Periconia macrospinosa TaxID=97972 RepID=A0A2V1D8N6_9PLEO|nr:hypothetical protein DM02DRAFT_695629 [Periconia macrospinosa]